MKYLSVQIQPERVPGLDMASLNAAFQTISKMSELVSEHTFDNGVDEGPYFNYTFGTSDVFGLWQAIQEGIYNSQGFGQSVSLASITVCSGEAGWNDCLLLFHYDPSVQIDTL